MVEGRLQRVLWPFFFAFTLRPQGLIKQSLGQSHPRLHFEQG